MFELHPKLSEDCFEIGQFPLGKLLLMNDSNYPWFILVPQRESIREIHELKDEDQQQLIRESSYLSEKLSAIFAAHKMNIAALGNVVPQLHIHHVVRYRDDPAWPNPVWGRVTPTPYDVSGKERVVGKVLSVIQNEMPFTIYEGWSISANTL
ncbi:MAG: HIT domain-containing protein [Proteobacteria bacterium]|nr:HIT domain-containing protein [Pseudomonadota bacterium]